MFQAGHSLCSKQDIPCVPSRTRLKNREDGSDFHDFLTKSIASPRTFFLKIFAAPKNFSCRRFRRCRRRRRRRSVNHTSYLQHCLITFLSLACDIVRHVRKKASYHACDGTVGAERLSYDIRFWRLGVAARTPSHPRTKRTYVRTCGRTDGRTDGRR